MADMKVGAGPRITPDARIRTVLDEQLRGVGSGTHEVFRAAQTSSFAGVAGSYADSVHSLFKNPAQYKPEDWLNAGLNTFAAVTSFGSFIVIYAISEAFNLARDGGPDGTKGQKKIGASELASIADTLNRATPEQKVVILRAMREELANSKVQKRLTGAANDYVQGILKKLEADVPAELLKSGNFALDALKHAQTLDSVEEAKRFYNNIHATRPEQMHAIREVINASSAPSSTVRSAYKNPDIAHDVTRLQWYTTEETGR